MDTTRNKDSRRSHSRERGVALSVAFLATVLAAPGHAVTFPSIPLQSGTAYPAPNVRFILDDSGSMNFVAMPKDIEHGDLQDTVEHKSYVHNTIYYNPAITYLPWLTYDASDKASRRTGGTAFDKAFSSLSLASGSTRNLSNSTQTFFVPKVAPSTSKLNQDYYRYQLIKVDGEVRVVRSTWQEVVTKGKDNEGVASAGCYVAKPDVTPYYWRNCEYVTPLATRDEAAELVNYATWYSYHRTRMKVAKAGASEAFGQIKGDMRIGFDSINRNHDDDNGQPAIPYNIPVGNADGLFKGTNRKTWYDTLHAAWGNDGTPLQRALQRAGKYFSTTGSAGPMGPEAKPFSCRQNFAILTTDGYWNSLKLDGTNAGDYQPVGDSDGTPGEALIDAEGKPILDTDGNPKLSYKVEKPYWDNYVEIDGVQSRSNTLADVAMEYWKKDLQPTLVNDVPTSSADEAFWQHMVTFGVSIGLKGRLTPGALDLDFIKKGEKNWGDPVAGGEDADRIDDLWHAAVNSRGNFLVASNTAEFVRGLLDAFNTVHERTGSASNVAANSSTFAKTSVHVYQATYQPGRWSGELKALLASGAGVGNEVWRASSQIPDAGDRKIFTWEGKGEVFPTATQKGLLDASTRLVAPVGADDNVDYIKGVQGKEHPLGALRNRQSRLGDIVNSSPVYVEDNETIFVGANDGMLHAFNKSGQEVFAYVPASINFEDLKSLSDPHYAHRYFVDGPITVSSRNKTGGKNYLVGALGRGGKGLFALDVTTPASMDKNKVLWELSGRDNLGNVLGEPFISRLNSGEDVAVFGNGYNSKDGLAVLFVVNLKTGEVIHEISTGVGGDNGLSAPRGWDDDNNGTVDYVYAGDLKGNLWKFDFTQSDKATVALNGKPLFAAGETRPFTAGLALARDPKTGVRWVLAATGRLLELGDLKNRDVQAIYGLKDEDSALTASQLQARGIPTVVGGERTFDAQEPLPDDKKGWYVPFNKPAGTGERVVSRPQVDGSVLLFSSIVPPTESTCNASGSGYINALDVFTGTSVGGDGYFKRNKINGVPVGSIDLGVGMPTYPIVIDDLVVVGGSGDDLGDAEVLPQKGQPRRVSWREILRD